MNLETMSLGERIRMVALLAAHEHMRQEIHETTGENADSHQAAGAAEPDKRLVPLASLEAA